MANNKMIIAEKKGVRPTAASLPEHTLAANIVDKKLFTNHKGEIIEFNDAGSYDSKENGGELNANAWTYIIDSDNYTLPEITPKLLYKIVRVRVDGGNTPIISTIENDKISFKNLEDTSMTFTSDSIVEFLAITGKWVMVEYTINGEGASGNANRTRVANSESAMLNVMAIEGDVTLRTDIERTFIHNGNPEQLITSWEVMYSGVLSVNGKTPTLGNVVLGKVDIGLALVENAPMSDAIDNDTIVSYASSKAISDVNDKVDALTTVTESKLPTATHTAHIEDENNPHNVTADDLGLGLVTTTLINHTAELLTKASQTSVNTVTGRVTTNESDLSTLTSVVATHIARDDNPHNVTAAQLNLDQVNNFPTSDSVTSINPSQNASSLAVKTANDRAISAEANAKIYTDAQVQVLLGDAPKAALDTLLELGTALEGNASDIATITNNIATKASQSALDTLTGRTTTNENSIASLVNTKATTTALSAHITDTDNPHSVNAVDVGLGNVGNYGSSSAIDSDSVTQNATSRAVKIAHEKGMEALEVANLAIGTETVSIPANMSVGWVRIATGIGFLNAEFQIHGRNGNSCDIKFQAGIIDGKEEGASINLHSAVGNGLTGHSGYYTAIRVISLDSDIPGGLKALEIYNETINVGAGVNVTMFLASLPGIETNWQLATPLASSGSVVERCRLDIENSTKGSTSRLLSDNSYVYDENNPPSYNALTDKPNDDVFISMDGADVTLSPAKRTIVSNWGGGGKLTLSSGFAIGSVILLYQQGAAVSTEIESAVSMWPDAVNGALTHTITGNYLVTFLVTGLAKIRVSVTPI